MSSQLSLRLKTLVACRGGVCNNTLSACERSARGIPNHKIKIKPAASKSTLSVSVLLLSMLSASPTTASFVHIPSTTQRVHGMSVRSYHRASGGLFRPPITSDCVTLTENRGWQDQTRSSAISRLVSTASNGGDGGEDAPTSQNTMQPFLPDSVDPADIPNIQLDHHFHTVMMITHDEMECPLLNDFDKYKNSLPTRDVGNDDHLILHECPYWASDEALNSAAKLIEKIRSRRRTLVHYAMGPSSSGKTASILPIFLNSAASDRKNKLTHYVYIAFHNNRHMNYTLTNSSPPSNDQDDDDFYMELGAEFMYQCIKEALQAPTTMTEIDLGRDAIPSFADTKEKMAQLISKEYLNGKAGRVLFHLDEHRKMTDDILSRLRAVAENEGATTEVAAKRADSYAAMFRRGAMMSLAQTESAVVVATYIESPSEIPTEVGSSVCRQPIPVPSLDARKAMASFKSLRIDADVINIIKGSKELGRLYATYMFQISLYMDTRLEELFSTGDDQKEADHPLNDELFGDLVTGINNSVKNVRGDSAAILRTAKENAVAAAFREAIKHCPKIPVQRSIPIPTEYAIDLLLSMTDDEAKAADTSELREIVAVGDQVPPKITAKFSTLLRLQDRMQYLFGGEGVYRKGRDKMFNFCLDSDDWLSGTPLEAAYAWTLSCMAVRDEGITFGGKKRVTFRCQDLRAGRVFAGADPDHHPDTSQVEEQVLYYVDETNMKPDTESDTNPDTKSDAKPDTKSSHPLCDLFFRDDGDGTIYLISITGGNRRNANKRVRNLTEWMRDRKATTPTPAEKFVGICLAPFAEGNHIPNDRNTGVYDIRGQDARELLGGLAQIQAFNLDIEDDE